MAVIVRRLRIDESGNESQEKVYESRRMVLTKNEKEQAEELDEFLAEKMQDIYEDLQSQDLLKGRGDVERWYTVGKHLAFVDDPAIVPPEDRSQDRYIWEALWAHAPAGVRAGPRNSRTGTARDFFRECYYLAQLPWDVVRQYTWSDWVNLLESPAVMEEDRIIGWLGRRLPKVGRDVLRRFARVLRDEFRNRELSVLTDEELETELETAWRRALSDS